jgi:3-hydroxyisobutyrate dehydrogenase
MEKVVGFIGLGAMGSRMAKNLLKAGFQCIVYDVRKEAVDELARIGARPASSPEEVARKSDVILLSLPSSPHVEEVMLGPNGVLKGARPGSLVIDLSTIDPITTRRIYDEAKKRGVIFIDAPVSGGTWGAEAATLTIMVGAPSEEVFSRAKEVLQYLGKKIVHVGDVGHGQVIKLANNAMGCVNLFAAIEALLWAAKQGVNLEKALEVISESSGDSWALRNRIPRIIKRMFEPGFKTWLMHKDIGIFLKTATEIKMYTPFIALAYQFLQLAIANGYADEDWGSVAKLYEKLLNIELKLEGLTPPHPGVQGE